VRRKLYCETGVVLRDGSCIVRRKLYCETEVPLLGEHGAVVVCLLRQYGCWCCMHVFGGKWEANETRRTKTAQN
jgi:hypothetical protein